MDAATPASCRHLKGRGGVKGGRCRQSFRSQPSCRDGVGPLAEGTELPGARAGLTLEVAGDGSAVRRAPTDLAWRSRAVPSGGSGGKGAWPRRAVVVGSWFSRSENCLDTLSGPLLGSNVETSRDHGARVTSVVLVRDRLDGRGASQGDGRTRCKWVRKGTAELIPT